MHNGFRALALTPLGTRLLRETACLVHALEWQLWGIIDVSSTLVASPLCPRSQTYWGVTANVERDIDGHEGGGGSRSFTLLVDADVKDGVFSGEKGEKGKPGWYSLNGKVQSDGTMEIFARGIVPSSRLAAGMLPWARHTAIPSAIGGHKGGRRSEGRPSLQRDFHQTVTSRESRRIPRVAAKGPPMSAWGHQRSRPSPPVGAA